MMEFDEFHETLNLTEKACFVFLAIRGEMK